MADSLNPTLITPPRVPFLDPQTGLISRAWYRWLLSLFSATNTGQIDTLLLQTAPDANSLMAALQAQVAALANAAAPSPTDLTPLLAAINGLSQAPSPVEHLRPATATVLGWLEA